MKYFLKHFFIPHRSNNQRARLLHNSSIFVLACLLLVGSVAVSYTKTHYHQVLGISASISSQDLLNLTNQARSAAGLAPLSLNGALSNAAAGKAEDMFTNNYWAHISPSGVTPWDFIRGSGYSYSYAGENLARGYTTASDAMSAWMASPEHRSNILSSNYTDVGFAVAQGNLTGDNGTILIVEEFGRPAQAVQQQVVPPVQQAAAAGQSGVPLPSVTSSPIRSAGSAGSPQANSGSVTPVPSVTQPPTHQVLTQVTKKPLIDSKKTTQTLAVSLLVVLILLLIVDMIFVGSKKIIRIVGHNLDHIIFFGTIIGIAIILGQGIIY